MVLGDDIYYFDEETGLAFTGDTEIWGGLETTFNEEGRLISGGTGFVSKGSNTLYYQKLIMYKGWLDLDGDIYYFSNVTGYMSTGLATVSGVVYHFSIDGKLIGK